MALLQAYLLLYRLCVSMTRAGGSSVVEQTALLSVRTLVRAQVSGTTVATALR